MENLAQAPVLYELPGQLKRWNKSVVETAHVGDASGFHRVQHRFALLGSAAQRLLAQYMLPLAGSGYGWLEVKIVGRAVVDEVHLGIVNKLLPVGCEPTVAVSFLRLAHSRFVAAADGHKLDRWACCCRRGSPRDRQQAPASRL